MPDKTLTRIDLPHAAHDVVTAADAAKLYADTGTEWAVSGRLTRDGYGRIGMRRAAKKVPLWDAPGVRQRGIESVEIGSTITTWAGTGVVTRKGTIAGFYILRGREERWEAEFLERVQAPTPESMAIAAQANRR